MSSFGEELKRERELRRITLREVADATKINLRYLEALDKNDFKHLPGGVFNRGFVRAYAQFIGVDPDQMVSAYLMEVNAQSTEGGGEPGAEPLLRGTASTISAKSQGPRPEGSGKWLKLGLAALIVAALIAGGVFVAVKFFGGSGSRGEAERTELPKTQTAPVSEPAAEPTEAVTKQPPPAKIDDAVDKETRPTGDAPGAATQTDTQVPAPSPAIAGGIGTTALPQPRSSDPGEPVQATIYVDRATAGRLNCDNRQIDLLNGMPPGTRFDVTCSTFLIVDADDGGALRIGWPGFAPASPGEAGVPLSGHRIDVRSLSTRTRTEDRP